MFTRSFDIDDTITAAPEHFANLSKETYAQGGRVVIITSRLDEPAIRASTVDELAGYGIRYDELYMFRTFDDMPACPHGELDWYSQYLWQKVAYAKQARVIEHYDDDIKVIELFTKHTKIKVIDANNLKF